MAKSSLSHSLKSAGLPHGVPPQRSGPQEASPVGSLLPGGADHGFCIQQPPKPVAGAVTPCQTHAVAHAALAGRRTAIKCWRRTAVKISQHACLWAARSQVEARVKSAFSHHATPHHRNSMDNDGQAPPTGLQRASTQPPLLRRQSWSLRQNSSPSGPLQSQLDLGISPEGSCPPLGDPLTAHLPPTRPHTASAGENLTSLTRTARLSAKLVTQVYRMSRVSRSGCRGKQREFGYLRCVSCHCQLPQGFSGSMHLRASTCSSPALCYAGQEGHEQQQQQHYTRGGEGSATQQHSAEAADDLSRAASPGHSNGRKASAPVRPCLVHAYHPCVQYNACCIEDDGPTVWRCGARRMAVSMFSG